MPEILLIALVILLLFGGKKIPELMKGLGKGVKSFKDGMEGAADDTAQIESKSQQQQQANDGSTVTIGRMGNKGRQYTDDGSSVSMDGMGGSSRQQYADDGSSVHIGRMDGKAEASDDGSTVTLNNIGRQN